MELMEEIALHNCREYFDLCFTSAPTLIEEWESFFGETGVDREKKLQISA
jgi:hypothetical protein